MRATPANAFFVSNADFGADFVGYSRHLRFSLPNFAACVLVNFAELNCADCTVTYTKLFGKLVGIQSVGIFSDVDNLLVGKFSVGTIFAGRLQVSFDRVIFIIRAVRPLALAMGI